VRSGRRPVRVSYTFDPRRSAILLIVGDKAGDNRFGERTAPVADDLCDTNIDCLLRSFRIRPAGPCLASSNPTGAVNTRAGST
jgi:hypothetical protein